MQVSPPTVRKNGPLQMLVTNLDYDEHKGRIAIGRVTSGKISRAETVSVGRPGSHPSCSCILFRTSSAPLRCSQDIEQHKQRRQALCIHCLNTVPLGTCYRPTSRCPMEEG